MRRKNWNSRNLFFPLSNIKLEIFLRKSQRTGDSLSWKTKFRSLSVSLPNFIRRIISHNSYFSLLWSKFAMMGALDDDNNFSLFFLYFAVSLFSAEAKQGTWKVSVWKKFIANMCQINSMLLVTHQRYFCVERWNVLQTLTIYLSILFQFLIFLTTNKTTNETVSKFIKIMKHWEVLCLYDNWWKTWEKKIIHLLFSASRIWYWVPKISYGYDTWHNMALRLQLQFPLVFRVCDKNVWNSALLHILTT